MRYVLHTVQVGQSAVVTSSASYSASIGRQLHDVTHPHQPGRQTVTIVIINVVVSVLSTAVRPIVHYSVQMISENK